MKKLPNLCVALILLCIGSFSNLFSQNTYAIVIGLSKYQEITPLQFADRDAVAFTEFLKTQNVAENNIKLYLNENATRLNVLDGLYNLTSQLKPKDRFYFYFGGHGDLEAQISSENSLLLLYNSFKTGYFKGNEFLQLSELRGWFESLAKKKVEVVFIADACHSGGLIGGKDGVNKTQQALLEDWDNVTKILSCKADEYSLEGKQWGGGRGLFSYHLVNGLIGRADGNSDKKISLSELNTYLKTNVSKQANPNIQTPVILGNDKLTLSSASTEGLEKLADLERKNFALISEVNIKSNDDKIRKELDAKLDTTIVETYKKFSKALKDKRVNIHDDSLDCALIHYRKLESYKLPDNLMQMVKRNMAVGLMELELDIMKGVREKGLDAFPTAKVQKAVQNLEETMSIFGSNHYVYDNLQARKLVLDSKRPVVHTLSLDIDTKLKEIKDNEKREKENLLKALAFEPNMISTYNLLSTSYRVLRQYDSATFYLEKVSKLLPNQAFAYFNLGKNYAGIPYKNANNASFPHPKCIENFERAISVDSTIFMAYEYLSMMYVGETHLNNPNVSWSFDTTFVVDYLKSIYWLEKRSKFVEILDNDIPKYGFDDYSPKSIFTNSPNKVRFHTYLRLNSALSALSYLNKDTAKHMEYFNKIKHKVQLTNSFLANWYAALNMYQQLNKLENEEQINIYFNNARLFMENALQIVEEAIKNTPQDNKYLISLHYRQIFTAMGSIHMALENYDSSEYYLLKAINLKLPENSDKINLKQRGGYSYDFPEKTISSVGFHCIQKINAKDYIYFTEPYSEMVLLKLNQNKIEEAYDWYEKALKISVAEKGNDSSGIPFTNTLLRVYKKIDKEKLLKLREKYFPNAEKVD